MKHHNTTHWFSNTRFYKIWRSIIYRCDYPTARWYARYWWRWITYLWNSFEEFKDDMYDSYLEHASIHWEKRTTIDRIDNDWHYSKENCRWATWLVQARNRTWRCRMLTYNWVTKNLSAWCEETNLKSSTIRMRLTYWWTIWKALWFE